MTMKALNLLLCRELITVTLTLTFERYNHEDMEESHSLLRSRSPSGAASQSAETDRTISDLVNEAVRLRLAEDARPAAFDERAHEPDLRFEDVLKDLKQRAKI